MMELVLVSKRRENRARASLAHADCHKGQFFSLLSFAFLESRQQILSAKLRGALGPLDPFPIVLYVILVV